MLNARHAVFGLALAVSLVACSQQDNAPAPAAAAAPDESASKLATYQKLVDLHNDALAVPVGEEIVSRYPDSAAAAEVGKTLPALKQRAQAAAETSRLAGLWLYQTSPMEGGTQNTATIYSSKPAGEDRVRLVLRRHSAWGQSVFLFGSGKGFKCAGNCKIEASFDGKPHPLTGFLPPTGEPAMFIKNDPAFIAALPKVKKITMDIVSAERGKQTVLFEVGGYDPDKFPPMKKK
jgi:hypothetical protein